MSDWDFLADLGALAPIIQAPMAGASGVALAAEALALLKEQA